VAQLSVVIPFPRRAERSLGLPLRTIGNVAFGAAVALAIAVAIVAVGPRFLPYQVLPVLTGSMEPALPTGALAVVVPVNADELAVGDIITFHHPHAARTYVTHRIASIEGAGASRSFVTKGDANALPDSWRIVATGTGWRYAFAIPVIGGLIVAFEASPLRFALFALPLLGLALIALFEIWRPRMRELRPAAAQAA
jgi:signal peptidase